MWSLNLIAGIVLAIAGGASLYSWFMRHARSDLFRASGFLCLSASLILREMDATSRTFQASLVVAAAVSLIYGAALKMKGK